jgi:copper(I)-binding protein
MLYQIINHKDNNSIKGTSSPAELRVMVHAITQDDNIASEVYEWAITPAFGSTRYDHDDFEIMLIVQDE